MPLFRFSFRRNLGERPLVPVFVPGEHAKVYSFRFSFQRNICQNHPFGKPPFGEPTKVLVRFQGPFGKVLLEFSKHAGLESSRPDWLLASTILGRCCCPPHRLGLDVCLIIFGQPLTIHGVKRLGRHVCRTKLPAKNLRIRYEK